MNYRILSNGNRYRVQYKLLSFLPIWVYLTNVNEGGGGSIMEFETLEKADAFVREHTDIPEWKVVGDAERRAAQPNDR